MLLGIHLNKGNSHVESLEFFQEKLNIETCQIFAYGPRSRNPVSIDMDAMKKKSKKVLFIVHSAYLLNPWNDDKVVKKIILEELKVCRELKGLGVVIHINKVTPQVIYDNVKWYLQNKTRKVKLILEMKAVKTDEKNGTLLEDKNKIKDYENGLRHKFSEVDWENHVSYEFPEKLNYVWEKLSDIEKYKKNVGFCIDTSHIWAGGENITSYNYMKNWLKRIKDPESICLFHLNGSHFPIGSGRDHHAPPFSKTSDLIWGNTKPKDSGVYAIVRYAQKHSIPIILECHDSYNLKKNYIDEDMTEAHSKIMKLKK